MNVSKGIRAMHFEETGIDEASWYAGYAAGTSGLEPAQLHEFDGLDRFSYWSGYIEGRAARRELSGRLQADSRNQSPGH